MTSVVGQQLTWVDDAGVNGWCIYEVETGPHRGTLVVGPSGLGGTYVPERQVPKQYFELDARERRAADRKAEELLCSLLTAEQALQREQTGLFDVDTPYGVVTLGTKYNIPVRSAGRGKQRSICVVPRNWDMSDPPTPDGDFWVNLLLMLHHDPKEFFRVAAVRA